jgi:signal peptidase II
MLYAIVVVIILILDQGLKYWTTVNLEVGVGQADLIPGIIHLTNIHNVGAAFSILENSRWFFIAITAVFIVAVIILLAKKMIRGKFGRWTLVLVLAGAIGNWIDRIIQGYVVDMFSFDFINFAIFNIADIFITIGGILFCLYIIFYRGEPTKPTKNEIVPEGRNTASKKRGSSSISNVISGLTGKKEAPVKTRTADRPRFIPRPAPEPIDPDDPFAEWLKPNYDDPSSKSSPSHPQTIKPKERPAPAPISDAFKPEEPELPDYNIVKDELSESESESEFTLEDIMAEFRE